MPYVLALAERGVAGAVAADPGLKRGVNVAGGQVTYSEVAQATGLPYADVDEVLGTAPAA